MFTEQDLRTNIEFTRDILTKLCFEFEAKTFPTQREYDILCKRLTLEEFYFQKRDGNVDRPSLKKAIVLTKEIIGRKKANLLKDELNEMESRGIYEIGSQVRRRILRELYDVLVDDLNPKRNNSLVVFNYIIAIEKLEQEMNTKGLKIGDRGYEVALNNARIGIFQQAKRKPGGRGLPNQAIWYQADSANGQRESLLREREGRFQVNSIN
jgi:hypothetical protein